MPTHEILLIQQTSNKPFASGFSNDISPAKFSFAVTVNSKPVKIKIPLVVRSQRSVELNINHSLIEKIYAAEFPGIVQRFHISNDKTFELLLRCRLGSLFHYYPLEDQGNWRNSLNLIIPQLLIITNFLHNTLGMAHRDLKLGNVLVGDDGILKLIDFDSVCELKAKVEAGIVTSEYVPPEFFTGFPDDYNYAAQDAFALGIMILMSLKNKGIFKQGLRYNRVAALFEKKKEECRAQNKDFAKTKEYDDFVNEVVGFSATEQLDELFSLDNITKHPDELAIFKILLKGLLTSDWKQRLTNLNAFQKEYSQFSLEQFRLFNPGLKFYDVIKSWNSCIESRDTELAGLKHKKKTMSEHLARLQKTSSTYLFMRTELALLKNKMAMLKADRMDVVLSYLLQNKDVNDSALIPKKLFDCNAYGWRKRNFVRELVFLTICDKIVFQQLYHKHDKKIDFSFNGVNSHALMFQYLPFDEKKPNSKEDIVISKAKMVISNDYIEQLKESKNTAEMSTSDIENSDKSPERSSNSERSSMSF